MFAPPRSRLADSASPRRADGVSAGLAGDVKTWLE